MPRIITTRRTILLLSLFLSLLAVSILTACDFFDWSDDASPALGNQGDEENVWTDSSTNLMWQNTFSDYFTSDEAANYCEELEWAGYDDWRLPTIYELRTLIRGCDATEEKGSCAILNDCLETTCWSESCEGCVYDIGPANGCYWPEGMHGYCDWYWSSSPASPLEGDPDGFWGVNFYQAVIGYGYIEYDGYELMMTWVDSFYPGGNQAGSGGSSVLGSYTRCVRYDDDDGDDDSDDDNNECSYENLCESVIVCGIGNYDDVDDCMDEQQVAADSCEDFDAYLECGCECTEEYGNDCTQIENCGTDCWYTWCD